MSAAPDFEPTPSEVLAHEEPERHIEPVPVSIDGPVRVQTPGAQIGIMRSITITTTPEIVLASNPRRARVLLFCATNSVRLGSKNDCDNDSAFLLPVNIPCEITHGDEVWARADTATARLSLSIEEWTA